MFDIYESERSSIDSLDRGTSPNGSSFDTLLSDDSVRSDSAVNFAPVLSIVV